VRVQAFGTGIFALNVCWCQIISTLFRGPLIWGD